MGEASRSRKLLTAAVIADALLLILQCVIALRFTGEQASDARSYVLIAQYCAENQTWYPCEYFTFAPYIFGNGYVSLLAACLRLAPAFPWIPVINIVCMRVIVLASARMARQLTGKQEAACLTVILLAALGGLWGEVVFARTELLFMALGALALCCLQAGTAGALLACGVLMALANWVRPLLVIYLPAAVVYMLQRRAKLRHYAALLAGVTVTVLAIGLSCQARTGRFLYQAQTMGVNMLMGANDDADGSFSNEVFEPGHIGYAVSDTGGSLPFYESDAFYKKTAVNWIVHNFPRFLSLVPAKLFYFLATDTYGGSAFFNNEVATDTLAYLRELAAVLTGRGGRPLALGDVVTVYCQLSYMAVFALC